MTVPVRRPSSVFWLVLSGLSVLLSAGVCSFLLAHDEGSKPHQGNPPLHAQDTMRAFQDDHHEPQSLSSMSTTTCTDGFAGIYPCRNVDLVAFLPLDQIGGGNGNDIWGWTDPQSGKEYAIMGRTSGTSFVDISDPANPVYLGTLPPHSSNSTWRDIKVYADHAFIVSEAMRSGMQVFDLTQLRTVISPPVTFSETAWYDGFLTAHNIAINEDSGYAYAVGTNNCSGGLHMINIQIPANPTFAGCYSGDGYTHDTQCVVYQGPDAAYQGREICFNSNEDTLTIVDVTDKSSPVLLSRTGYSGSAYTHQGWLTEDHQYFLIDDEMDERNYSHNTRTYIWDVSNLDQPVNTGFYTGTTSAIDHNQYIRGYYSYQANYRSGLRILDISGIADANLAEVAYFDVYPDSDSPNFNGAWSNYPFFASGIVVVSGIEQGLFILKPNLEPGSSSPSVNIVSPVEGASVSGSVLVQIHATDAEDASGALTVQWNVDGGNWQPATYSSGSGYYEASWDTTTTGNGAKTINAKATDSSSLNGADSISVNVSNPLPALHIASIEVVAVHVSGPRYSGEATVKVVDAGDAPVSGVTVDGTFTGDSSGSASALTDANGQATLQAPAVRNGSNWTFCVDSATKDGWSYDSGANVETCDSTGGSATYGAISGRVTDSSTGQAIAGADVSTDSGQSAITDTNGDYTIDSVPTGARTVTAAASGYTTQQKQTDVSESATSVVDFALTPEASGTGAIKGTVTDSAGAKLSGVLVATDTGQSALTNRAGKYSIQNVPEGSRTVTASKEGYATQQKSATVVAGQTTIVDFTLSP